MRAALEIENSDAIIAELQEQVSHLRERLREVRTPSEVATPVSGKLPSSWCHRATPAFRYAVAVLLAMRAWLTTTMLMDSLRAAYFQTPFFFCATVLSSWVGGFGAGMCSTLLSIVLLVFYFPQPLYNPGLAVGYVRRFVIFLVEGDSLAGWEGAASRRGGAVARGGGTRGEGAGTNGRSSGVRRSFSALRNSTQRTTVIHPAMRG